MSKITIYSTPSCHFCHMAKDFFKEKGVEFEDFDVSVNLEKRKEMLADLFTVTQKDRRKVTY